MAIKLNKTSDVVDKQYYRIPKFISVDFSDIEGRPYVLKEGDRLDVLAEEIFQDPSYWRVLAIYNGIEYLFDAAPGMTIMIPLDVQKVINRL